MTSEVPQSRILKSLVEPHYFKETQWNPREEMWLSKGDIASELTLGLEFRFSDSQSRILASKLALYVGKNRGAGWALRM